MAQIKGLPKKNRFKPVAEGARQALADILSLGLPVGIARRTVARIFKAPLEDAMELTQGDAANEVKPVVAKRGRNRTESQ